MGRQGTQGLDFTILGSLVANQRPVLESWWPIRGQYPLHVCVSPSDSRLWNVSSLIWLAPPASQPGPGPAVLALYYPGEEGEDTEQKVIFTFSSTHHTATSQEERTQGDAIMKFIFSSRYVGISASSFIQIWTSSIVTSDSKDWRQRDTSGILK